MAPAPADAHEGAALSEFTIPTATLNDGHTMPQVGYGVWQVEDAVAEKTVAQALEAGYRSIDTAAIYGNEEGTGKGIKASGVAREDIFLTTKVWNGEQGYDTAIAAAKASLQRLGTDYVDLLLIHWPCPAKELYVDTWSALVDLRSQGLARSIGVSNFQENHLQAIIDETGIVPVLNQVENHPYLVQEPLRSVHERHGIKTEAWSPLGQGKDLLQDSVIAEIAAAHDATAGQVVLAWHLANGTIVIPKTVTQSRMTENLGAVNLTLSAAELAAITGLNRDERLGGDPDVVGND
ncbi:aldo/keto reductase [Micrococcales bacterium 31B]|nr:aldo/keto reductase [Micrococcales bacterium 31B]